MPRKRISFLWYVWCISSVYPFLSKITFFWLPSFENSSKRQFWEDFFNHSSLYMKKDNLNKNTSKFCKLVNKIHCMNLLESNKFEFQHSQKNCMHKNYFPLHAYAKYDQEKGEDVCLCVCGGGGIQNIPSCVSKFCIKFSFLNNWH